MSTPEELKEELKTSMQAAMPDRVVTRNFVDFSLRDRADLIKGVISIVDAGEKDYMNTIGRLAQQGTLKLLLIGQLEIETGDPIDVEIAESTLLEQIKEFFRVAPGELGSLLMHTVARSQQLEHPYGWVGIDATLLT